MVSVCIWHNKCSHADKILASSHFTGAAGRYAKYIDTYVFSDMCHVTSPTRPEVCAVSSLDIATLRKIFSPVRGIKSCSRVTLTTSSGLEPLGDHEYLTCITRISIGCLMVRRFYLVIGARHQ